MYRDPTHLNEFTDFLVRQATKFLDDYWDKHNATRRVSAIYSRKQLNPQENPGLRMHCKALQRFLNSLERGCHPETVEYIENGLKQGKFQFGYHSTANEAYPIIMDSGFDPFRRRSQTHGRGEYMGVYPYDSHWYSRNSGRMMIVLFRTERMRVANAQAAYVIDNPVSHDVSDCLPILLLEHCAQAKSGQVQLRKYGKTPEPLHVTVGSWHITWKGVRIVATTITTTTTTSNSEAVTSGKEETKSIVMDPETANIRFYNVSSSSSDESTSSDSSDDDASDADRSSSPRVGPERLRALSVSSPGSCATTVVSPEPSESESVPISLGSSLSPTSSASVPQASQWYLRSPLASPSGFSSPVATSDPDSASQSSSSSVQISSYPTASPQASTAASTSHVSTAVSRSQSSAAQSHMVQTKVGSQIKRFLSDLRGFLSQ